MNCSYVFVYGTLKQNEPNHHWMQDKSQVFVNLNYYKSLDNQLIVQKNIFFSPKYILINHCLKL